jgi:phospholipid transport system substrate-binding protein
VIAQLIVGTKKWGAAKPNEGNVFIKSATKMLTFMYAKNVASAGKYRLTLFFFDDKNTGWQKKALIAVNGKITNIDNNQSSDFAVRMFKKMINVIYMTLTLPV